MKLSAPRPKVIEALANEQWAAIDVLAHVCEAYGERPALGERALVLEGPPSDRVMRILPEFQTITYKTVWQRTVELATGLVRDPRILLKQGEIAGIYGFGSIDYVVADLACLYAGAVSAVLQMGMAGEELKHLVNEAGVAVMICSLDSLSEVLPVLSGCPCVRSVVVMDLHGGETREVARLAQAEAKTALPLTTVHDLARRGRAGAPLAPFRPAAGTDPLATLMYTSGSTGFPKGAMMTHQIWRSYWQVNTLTQFLQIPSIGINFYPLSHLMGRDAVLRTLLLGGVMHFTSKSDLSTLFEDIRLVRPTFLYLVPRIAEMIYQAYRADVQTLLKSGMAKPAAQAQAVTSMRATFLGDRLMAAVIGSAPTDPEIMAFLTSCFEIPVFEGYGSTEGGLVTIDGVISRPLVKAYQLAEVPELGYRLSDKPFPRGELLIKTWRSIPGFLNNAAATRALYDDHQFLRTGDIVEERAPDQIHWVDRKNNVVKLAQGEFITIWRLEGTFSSGSPLLDQVYLYANSQRAYPLAVLVPEWTAVHDRLRMEGNAPTPAAVRQLLRGEINRVAREAQLRAYEVPRDFLVEGERWTRENGFLTGVNKPARPQLKGAYGERLEALYAQLEAQQEQTLEALALDSDDASVGAKVQKAVEAVLGLTDLDLAAGSFKDLGGDSISALSLSRLLEAVRHVPVPVAAILNPASSLQALVQLIEAQSAPGAEPRPTFQSIHGLQGSVPEEVRAEDLRLERFLSPEELAEAETVAAQPLAAAVRTVLLTGANGFLGHILCLEWLAQMAKVGGKVMAMVRAPNDQAAALRLGVAYRTGDPSLEQRFAALAAERLDVVAGDLAAPRLGLTPEVYERLACEVDLIVHAGAMVNHVFSYEQLFGSNVVGTAQLLRLALHGQRKRIDYVSTIGVLEGARAPGRVDELAGVDALKDVWPVDGGYAHGYATSKWASEVLLKAFHERFGGPVRVFRPGMILPHRHYRGQANGPDLLTRLLLSVVATGIAPRSFYTKDARAKAHYDGLPVDFVATAMATLSSASQDGAATFQFSNAHWEDGVSLDSLIDWVASAGYPVERIPDHADWYEAFKARLEAMPAEARAHSALPILQSWAKPIDDGEPLADATRFCQQVRQLKPGGESELPHLSEGFLHKYLEDLRALGLLQNPPTPQARKSR